MGELGLLAEFTASLRTEQLPAEVVERARLVLLDTLAVMIAGGQEDRVKRMAQSMRRRGSIGRSMLVSDRLPADAADAAMLNGVSACAHVLDEGHKYARGHVATYVVPAVLAVAEERSKSGSELIASVVAAYEVAARIGMACQVRETMHPSGTWGTVGAAAAVAALMGMSPAQIRESMNVAAPITLATSWQAAIEGATVRDLYSGFNGHTGVWAPRWVLDGFTGAHDGVGQVFGGVSAEHFDRTALVKGLGQRWEIMYNYFKLHACCRNFQSGIDTALEMLRTQYITPDDIESVLAETWAAPAKDNLNPNPANALAAKESFPVSLALTLLHGRCDQSVFAEEAVFAPAVKQLADKVKVVCDPELDALCPEQRPTRLTIRLKGGRTVSGYAAVALGDPDKPINRPELEEKFFSITAPVIGEPIAFALKRMVDEAEQLPAISDLLKPLSR